tara:strand:+ start:1180 stop:1515 length:336 start_codon:yes stop_codon:yes gene_type:complete
MKNIILVLVALFSLNLTTYASFPVTENVTKTEIVADDANLAMEAPYRSDFYWGGFLLGFFLGLLGVLIAYLIDPDWLRSSLYGMLALLVIYLILLFTVISAVASTADTVTY